VATPLVQAKSGQMCSISHLFLGSVSGSAGETSAILIILGRSIFAVYESGKLADSGEHFRFVYRIDRGAH